MTLKGCPAPSQQHPRPARAVTRGDRRPPPLHSLPECTPHAAQALQAAAPPAGPWLDGWIAPAGAPVGLPLRGWTLRASMSTVSAPVQAGVAAILDCLARGGNAGPRAAIGLPCPPAAPLQGLACRAGARGARRTLSRPTCHGVAAASSAGLPPAVLAYVPGPTWSAWPLRCRRRRPGPSHDSARGGGPIQQRGALHRLAAPLVAAQVWRRDGRLRARQLWHRRLGCGGGGALEPRAPARAHAQGHASRGARGDGGGAWTARRVRPSAGAGPGRQLLE